MPQGVRSGMWLYLHIIIDPAPAGMVQEAEHECEAAEIEDDDGSGRY